MDFFDAEDSQDIQHATNVTEEQYGPERLECYVSEPELP